MGTYIKGVGAMNYKTADENYSFEIRELLNDPSDDHNLDYKVIDETWNENVYRIHEHQFKNNGIFVDIGAHDGITINNTLYFEKNNNWTGINVEPLNDIFNKLIKNRPNNININCAVCNNDGEEQFYSNIGYTEMLSGIINTFDDRHLNRLKNENIIKGSTTEIITVKTKKLETILNENNITHINYLSIDVEGGEFEVIKSINFNNVFIDVIAFESHFDNIGDPIIKYLENKNYIVIRKSMDIFMINKNSIFYNNILIT
jgi:FkbM family methyltransferase